mgnify:CR=1 FL=1
MAAESLRRLSAELHSIIVSANRCGLRRFSEFGQYRLRVSFLDGRLADMAVRAPFVSGPRPYLAKALVRS